MTEKRKEALTWDEYFLGVAQLTAERSKDPNSQVGCCIVDEDNKIMALGYNGFPRGCSDDEFPWNRDNADTDPYNAKYFYVVHSEMNAILNAHGRDLRGSRLYVTLFPCNECAKAIIQSGIREIIYAEDKYADTPGVKASKRMLTAAGVGFRKYDPTGREVKIRV